MLIPYGWGTKLKKTAPMGIGACGGCNSFAMHYLGKVVFRVHICYIPIFWKTKGYYVYCGSCERGFQIKKEEFRRMKPAFKTFTNKKMLMECYNKTAQLCAGLEASDENVQKVFGELVQVYPQIGNEIIAQHYTKLISDLLMYSANRKQLESGNYSVQE